MVHRPELKNEPYCSNCGYRLTGLTESSRCPECGRPLVEVLTRNQAFTFGKRWRSRARLFGLPVIDIAFGPHGTETRGKARGIIAIGDTATGGLALGGIARGIVAVGAMAVGICAAGGMAVGLLMASGGLAIGGIAVGGCAIGGIAVGGAAIGGIASGGGAAGIVAQGGGAFGHYVRDARGTRPAAAAEVFASLSWLLGSWPPRGAGPMLPMIANVVLTILAAAIVAIPALVIVVRDDWARQDPA
jgi:hypothetical protein